MNQQNNQSSTNKRKVKNDLILISSLIVILSIVGLCFMFFRADGNSVTVTVDGKLFGTYSLNEDKTVEIRTGENGENLNLLVIEGGRAFVKTATCPDGICASHKPIFREGESIVCLPHRVVITADSVDPGQPDIIV